MSRITNLTFSHCPVCGCTHNMDVCPDCVRREVERAQQRRVVMVQHISGAVEVDPDLQWPGRTVYLVTTVENGIDEPYALRQYSTPDTVAEARANAKHDLDWFGAAQGFKTTCRISIDNVFEEISKYDPGAVEVAPDFVSAADIADMQARCEETETEPPTYDGMWK